MANQTQISKPEHWPKLNTVIMVEKTMQEMNSIFSVAELKRKLPKQVNHNTLILILKYLEISNKIIVSIEGITWIHNANPNLKKATKQGLKI